MQELIQTIAILGAALVLMAKVAVESYQRRRNGGEPGQSSSHQIRVLTTALRKVEAEKEDRDLLRRVVLELKTLTTSIDSMVASTDRLYRRMGDRRCMVDK